MKSFLKTSLCLMIAICLIPSASFAQGTKLGIVTGSETGTYIKFGKDIRKMLIIKRQKINLKVHTSSGSLENIFDVFDSPKAQLGIVQSDVLAFIETRTDEDMRKIARKTRLVHPLYNEEVHILANESVQSFEDLEGKRVAIGGDGSGTNLTATTLFKLGGIEVIEKELSGANALDALKAGDIDAMIYVAGYPVKLFKEQVRKSDKLHLVPIQNEVVSYVYNINSTIPKDTYKFLKDDVNTVAVKAVLITYDYQKEKCGLVGSVGNAIIDNIDWLRNNGHPKWKEVDLTLELAGWTQYECVRGAKKPKANAGGNTQFDEFLKAIKKKQ